MGDERLQIVISATDQASPALKAVAGNAKAIGDAAKQTGAATEGAFGRMAAGAERYSGGIVAAGAAMTAFGAITVAVARDCLAAVSEAEQANLRLGVAIRNAGTGVSDSGLKQYADDLMRLTDYDDEAIKGMMSFLVAAKLSESQVRQLSPAMLDLAEFMGKDLTSAAQLVSYALETGNVAGFKRLKIAVDETKFAMDPVAALTEAITAKFGGMATEARDSLGGSLKALNNEMGETKEKLGGAIAPAAREATEALIPMVKVIGDLAEAHPGLVKVAVATGLVGGAVGALGLGALGAVIGVAKLKKEMIELGIISKGVSAQVTADATKIAVGVNAAGVATNVGVAGTAGRVGTALGARGALRAVGAAAGKFVLPAYLAYEGLSYYWNSKAARSEQEAAAIESGATETPEEKALIASNMARWKAGRGSAGLQPAAALPGLAALESDIFGGATEISPGLGPIGGGADQKQSQALMQEVKSRWDRGEIGSQQYNDALWQLAEQGKIAVEDAEKAQRFAPMSDELYATQESLRAMAAEGSIPRPEQMTGLQRRAWSQISPKEREDLGRMMPATPETTGIASLGKGAFQLGPAPEASYGAALRSQRGAGIPRRGVTGQGHPYTVTESPLPGGGSELLIRVQIADAVPPGVLTDGVTDWMDDLQYAVPGAS